MKILSRYVARDFIRYWLLCLTALVMLVVISHLFGNIDRAFASWAAFTRFVRETAATLPTMVEYMFPMTVLLATALTFSGLARGSELIAMKAAGMGTGRLLLPMLLLCVPIAALVYTNQHTLHDLLAAEAEAPRGTLRDRWLSRGNAIYYVSRANPETATVLGVRAFHLADGDNRLAAMEQMGTGWRDDERWHFRDVILRRAPADVWDVKRVNMREVPSEDLPDLIHAAELDAHHMPFFDLYGKIRQLEDTSQRVVPYRVELYQKTAALAAPFLMVLLGAPLARVQGRRSGKVVTLTLTIIGALAYIIVGETLIILGKGGYVPPLAAAWGLNAVFAVLGLLLVRQAR